LTGAGRSLLVGLYGLERLGSNGQIEQSGPAQAWKGRVADVADVAERAAPPGLLVERKGLTVTLHYRPAPSLAEWVEEFAADQASQTGLVAHPGKMSVELRPPVEVDKGTVVAELSAGMDAVCYLGDDVGDIPAFAALRRLAAADPATSTLAVAVAGPETPTEVTRAADLVVDGPAGALDFLTRLADGT
jgi:trehalose 6-phosphate phosphatase